MAKNELPDLNVGNLEQALWETLHAVKNKKLSKDGAQGVVAVSNGIINIQKAKMIAAKQSKELGTQEQLVLGQGGK